MVDKIGATQTERPLNGTSITEIASGHARWLMARQKAVAENISNASSPGYRAVDVAPFANIVAQARDAMSLTAPAHIDPDRDRVATIKRAYARASETTHSGNTVSIDQQLIAANVVRQGYALNSSIVRSFHRLALMAAKV